ncbi:rifin [Plasmodium reichenowi]|uniref:Rifin n=1 Tax=Plasmodium reichenowi TaxID=5854 RepID=A0A060RM55_PLARE|nr:rifin [Plasmodium reichenowi]
MKVHYINILLFALLLNILVYNHRNHKSITPCHTQTNRSLCECELYEPDNYDNDPEMKRVMQQFQDRTSQRFHEYDDRIIEKRKRCKDECDKEIQKIILKDKLEKQMEQQLTTLETKIDTDDIPTCVCEKSLAGKVEKTCLRCGSVFGGGVMPGMGLIDGSLLGAISVLQPAALKAAKAAALTEAKDLATKAGMDAVISKIEGLIAEFNGYKTFDLRPIVTPENYKCGTALVERAKELFGEACNVPGRASQYPFCNTAIYSGQGELYVGNFGQYGSDAYNATYTLQKEALEKTYMGAVESTYGAWKTTIIASVVTIVVIVLIMVIIYLILRYRRKKKMKKKLRYIKLLEE